MPIDLQVEHYANAEWSTFELNYNSPGFLIFVYSLFTCQHAYMRLNCAEQGITLSSAKGHIQVCTDEEWNITEMSLEFIARTRQGQATTEEINHIIQRMEQCPASRNIKLPEKLSIKLELQKQ